VACEVLRLRGPQPCTQYVLTCCPCNNFPQTLQGNPCPAVQGPAAPPSAHRMGAIPPEVHQGVPLAGAQARAAGNPHLLSRQPCARSWQISDLAVQCAQGPGRHRQCTPGAPENRRGWYQLLWRSVGLSAAPHCLPAPRWSEPRNQKWHGLCAEHQERCRWCNPGGRGLSVG
jgi:hypothetical protein